MDRSRTQIFPRARARGLIEDRTIPASAACCRWHFRGHVPAASLKTVYRSDDPKRRLLFPRARARGLIEESRGPRRRSSSDPFPRARARGLIEEAPGQTDIHHIYVNFRGHVPAASLKKKQRDDFQKRQFNFRGHVPAASLKRYRDVRVGQQINISAGTCPRPH